MLTAKLLLVLVSTVILDSEMRGNNGLILWSDGFWTPPMVSPPYRGGGV
jgi:hypothetical protein